MAYGGSQKGNARIEVDPETGDQRVVEDTVEVSPESGHQSTLKAFGKTTGQLMDPRKSMLPYLLAYGSTMAPVNTGLNISGQSLGEVAGHMAPELLGSTGTANAMGNASFLAGSGGSAGIIPSVGGASFAPAAASGFAAPAAATAGVSAPAAAQLRTAASSAPSDYLRGASKVGQDAAGGMDWKRLLGLTGLQMGTGMLEGLFAGDDDANDPNARLKYFEGGGEFVDPKRNMDRYNRSATYMNRAFAGRGPVVGLRGEKSPVQGLDNTDFMAYLDSILGKQ